MPAVLQRLMRHASIETTMRYYVDQQAEDLWRMEPKPATPEQLQPTADAAA
jgi:hypothetical protein